MPKLPKYKKPEMLQKLMWQVYIRYQQDLFIKKMNINKSTFYRWMNGVRYPCLNNVRLINKVLKTKQFLGTFCKSLPE